MATFDKPAVMATVSFSVAEDVRDDFNAALEGKSTSAVIAELMREAVDREARCPRSRAAIGCILSRRAQAPQHSSARLRSARERAGFAVAVLSPATC